MSPLRIDVPVMNRRRRALARTLRVVGRGATDAAVEAQGEQIVKLARRRNYGFTDRTGRLRRSVRLVRDGLATAVRAGGRGVDYAAVVEYRSGGRFSYLRRAVRASRASSSELKRRVDRALRSLVRRR